MKKNSQKVNFFKDKPALLGIFIATAAAFQAVEGLMPRPFPWLRLGMGNMVVLVAIITMGRSFAFKIFLGKVVMASFILGTFLSPSFYLSLSGGFAAWAAMSLLYRPLGKLGPVGVSISGAVSHSLAQAAVAYFILIRHWGLFYFLPLILFSSAFSGWITGIIAVSVSPAVAKYSRRKIYLASGSERRINMMKSRGLPLIVAPTGIREDSPTVEDEPESFALRQAEKKLLKAVENLRPPGVAVAADTIVESGGKIYVKPRDSGEAEKMIRELSNSVQNVYTAVIAQNIHSGVRHQAVEKTALRLKKIPEEVIKQLASENMDKSGGYALQGLKDKYIKWMRGSYSNAVGFPLKAAARLIIKAEKERHPPPFPPLGG